MKTIIYNDDNLSTEDIEDKVMKARVIMINCSHKIYLSIYAGMYLFPGGKIEVNEDLSKGAEREVKEETGIELDLSKEKPFLFIRQFIKDYPKRDTDNYFSNRLNETYYYLVYTDENINIDKMHLMDNEIEYNFKTIQIGLDEVPLLLTNNHNNNIRNKYFSREVEIVTCELKKVLNK